MSILQALFLGLLQGITEFLPISSSGHLVVAETLLGLHVDELKDFDVALHVGTLMAILVYFRKDLLNFKWWPWLILASVPAAVVGLTLEDQIDAMFRGAHSVATLMILVGLLFFIPQRSNTKKLTWWRALLMGCGQAIAVIPGVSRSGASIFTGMQLGLNREEAARFSFLLGSIAIAGAGLLKALDTSVLSVQPSALLVGFLAAFVSSLFAAKWLMKFLKTHSFKAFGIYRVLFGASLLIVLNVYLGELESQLTITPKVEETRAEQKSFPTGDFTFKEGTGNVLGGAYTGLALSFYEATAGGTLEFSVSLPSTEELSFSEAWDDTSMGKRTWWLESEVPTLPFTFDQGLFEGLYSDRLQGPVLPEFKLLMQVEAERALLYFEDFEITLERFEVIDGTKLTLDGIFSAENEGYLVGGELHLYKVPLGITDIE